MELVLAERGPAAKFADLSTPAPNLWEESNEPLGCRRGVQTALFCRAAGRAQLLPDMVRQDRAEKLDFASERRSEMSGPVELLEEYLRTAPIMYRGAWPHGGAHQNKMELILEGGLSAIAKPSDWADGPRTVWCECAAWEIAKLLGWTSLLAVTVLRSVKSVADQPVDASVQIAWPRASPDQMAAFGDDDVWKAAVFDHVIENTDRGGHNWLSVPEDAAAPMLKLVDHGYALGAPGRPFASTFFDMKNGQRLPEEVKLALRGMLGARAPNLPNAPKGEWEKALERAQALIDGGTLERA